MRLIPCLLLASFALAQENALAEARQKLEAGDFAGALAAFDKAIEGAPGDGRGHAGRAEALGALGRLEEAFASVQRAVELAPNDPHCLHVRSLILVARGDDAAALADIENAIEIDPARGILYQDRANLAARRRDYDGALRDYSKAYELGLIGALEPRSRTKAALRDWKGALEDCTMSVGATQWHPYAHFLRGEMRLMLGDWKRAIVDYDAALRKKEHAPSYVGRARARFALGDREMADADARRAVETCPCVDCFTRRGGYYFETGRPKEAAADFAKAVQMGPEWQDYTRFFLFLARTQLGEREEATAELSAYADGRERKDDWYTKVAAFLTGQMKEDAFLAAANAENQYLAREQRCEACFYAGALRALDGDTAGAKVLFEKCIATDVRLFREYGAARAALAAMK